MSLDVELKVSNLISGIDNLPTPPIVYTQINEAIANPNASAYQIASIISEDPAMSAKILRLSNSVFYGVRSEISSAKQAVVTIGLEAIKSLVLSTAVLDAFKCPKETRDFQDEFWRHSLAVGSACRLLVRKVSSQWISSADKVFSAGMLHDIGKLVMIVHMQDEWQKRQDALKENDQPENLVENDVLGYNHADVGATLALKWNLPNILVDAIKFHHCPFESEDEDSLAPLVFCANFLAHRVFDNIEDDELEISPTDEVILSKFKITPEVFKELKTSLIEEYAKSEVFLDLAKGL